MKLPHRNHLNASLSEINITPLVDVMLVLLIIFMVTAPMMQAGINIRLPEAETKANPSEDGLTISVSQDRYIHIEKQVINLHLLESRIKNHFFNREKKVVFLRADKALPYGYIMEVMDIIKKAGVETVGLIVENKSSR